MLLYFEMFATYHLTIVLKSKFRAEYPWFTVKKTKFKKKLILNAISNY